MFIACQATWVVSVIFGIQKRSWIASTGAGALKLDIGRDVALAVLERQAGEMVPSRSQICDSPSISVRQGIPGPSGVSPCTGPTCDA